MRLGRVTLIIIMSVRRVYITLVYITIHWKGIVWISVAQLTNIWVFISWGGEGLDVMRVGSGNFKNNKL